MKKLRNSQMTGGYLTQIIYNTLSKFSFVLIFATLIWSACTKSSPFGADLLDDQAGDYVYTDTVTVICSTVREDSIRSGDPNSTADYLLCGKIIDPIFGTSEAEIFTLIQPADLGLPQRDTTTIPPRLDSIVMYLMLDPKGIYGDTLQNQTISVYRVNNGNQINWNKLDYRSTDKMDADQEIGSTTFAVKPTRRDSLVYGYGKSRTVLPAAGAFVRIPLSASFGEELLGINGSPFDSLTYTNDSLFWQKIRGLKIKTTTPDSKTMLALDLNNTNLSRITLFYTKLGDTIPTRYHYQFTGGNKFVHITHDYTGSTVAQHINKADDDLLFMQGMAGLKVQLDIPYANNFDNVAINKAELELTATSLPGDNLQWYPPASQFVLTDTSKTLTYDVLYSVGANLNQGFSRFGGYPLKEVVNGQSVFKYRMMLGQRFQDMVDQNAKDLKGTRLYLNVYPQLTSPMRTVFYGQRGASFPAKLIVKYTKL